MSIQWTPRQRPNRWRDSCKFKARTRSWSLFAKRRQRNQSVDCSQQLPDCLLTAGNLFREASLHDPRSLPSFAQVAALSERLSCSLPEAHDDHLVHHVHVFTDGSVDFDEARPSSLVPPSALSAGFSGVVFVACGEEILFLGAFWSPLSQHFSQCKTPSASQAELAAVASTLKFFGSILARHRVDLTIHADCFSAI